jgi:hypothetical protein
MRRRRRFFTGLCVSTAIETTPTGVRIRTRAQPWTSLRGQTFELQFKPLHIWEEEQAADISRRSRRLQRFLRPLEIQILAESQQEADLAALYLYAAHSVIDGCVPMSPFAGWDPYTALPLSLKDHFNSQDAARQLDNRTKICPDFEKVAGLAAVLSRDPSLANAAFYFLVSSYIVSLNPMAFHPRWGNESVERGDTPLHRIMEAQAIFSAFQAIEALDLTVKGATPKKKSVENGKWNTEIRADLEQRLGAIGISPTETVLWLRRGTPTDNHRRLESRTTVTDQATWSEGQIQDQLILFVDAINHAGWLRSNVSAHRSVTRRELLSPVDVTNVQHLARMLILNAARYPL